MMITNLYEINKISLKRRIKDLEKIRNSIDDDRVKELVRIEILRKKIDLCSIINEHEGGDYRGHEINNEYNDDEKIECDFCKTSVKELIDLEEEFRRFRDHIRYNSLGGDIDND